MSVAPCLTLRGAARTATRDLARIVGATDLQISTSGESPPAMLPADTPAEGVMHSQLSAGPGASQTASDIAPSTDSGTAVGSPSVIHAALEEARARKVFEALAEGGRVTVPLGPTFSSPAFDMVTDRWGVDRMIPVLGQGQAAP